MPRFVEANGLRHAYLEEGAGDMVLLLHGFPDHAPSFRHQMAALAAAGYRPVAPWLRGYAPTDLAPDGCYMTCAAADDAAALIEMLGGGRAHVVGHDWGAAVAYGLACRYKDRVASLTTMAVPHAAAFGAALLGGDYDQLRRSWYMFFFQMAGLADAVVAANGFRFIDRLWADWSPGYRRTAEEKAALNETLSVPGVVSAALAWYRAALGPAQDPARANDQAAMAGPVPIPTLTIFGADDGCISPDIAKGTDAFFPAGLRVEVIEGAGHFCHLERPDDVTRLVLEQIQGGMGGSTKPPP